MKQIKDTVAAVWPKIFCPQPPQAPWSAPMTLTAVDMGMVMVVTTDNGVEVTPGLTFFSAGRVMFRLHTAVCGRPLGFLHSFRKVRRPQGSWPLSLTYSTHSQPRVFPFWTPLVGIVDLFGILWWAPPCI